jgi:hypothetical protein
LFLRKELVGGDVLVLLVVDAEASSADWKFVTVEVGGAVETSAVDELLVILSMIGVWLVKMVELGGTEGSTGTEDDSAIADVKRIVLGGEEGSGSNGLELLALVTTGGGRSVVGSIGSVSVGSMGSKIEDRMPPPARVGNCRRLRPCIVYCVVNKRVWAW